MPGTVKAFENFDVEEDCKELRASMKGLGTNEAKIINILGKRNLEQRLEIAARYKTMFGKVLIGELKSELSSNFLRLCTNLLLTIPEFLAKEMKRAMKGSGTDEIALIEILVGLDNKGIQDLRHAYKLMFGQCCVSDLVRDSEVFKNEVERDVVGETSGSFKKLAVSLLQGKRDETEEVDIELAKEDAEELFNAGINRFGTDESKFNAILVTRSYRHLKMVFAEYKRIASEDIEKSIKAEMTGDIELGFLSVVKKIKNCPTYFAEELYKSMKGLGTDDDQLIRIVVWRSEIDLVEIKGAFHSLYAKSLPEFIKEDTSGDFRTLLLLIVD